MQEPVSLLSIWLVPSADDEKRKIWQHKSLTQQPPHISLVSWQSTDLNEALATVDKVAEFSKTFSTGFRDLTPHLILSDHLNISFSAPTIGDVPIWQSYILDGVQEKSDKLAWELQTKLAALFDKKPSARFPHLSLFYGTPEEREAAIPSIKPLADWENFSMSFTSLQVMIAVEKISDWQYFGTIPLASNLIYRDNLFINNKWVQTTKSLPVENPANKQIFHSMSCASASDVDLAVKAARDAFPLWSALSPAERAKYLNLIADEIDNRKELIADLEVLDNGKPRAEAVMDVGDASATFRYYADLISKMSVESNVELDADQKDVQVYVRKEPIGVCGLIVPWNYPLLMATWKVAPCLASGSTAILKPSESTSLSALELGAIAIKVGLPKGVLNIIPGYGADVGGRIAEHPDIDKVAFTGSVATGTKVMTAAAKSIKSTTLELGGKSPILVFPDANLEQSIDWITTGIFFNAGQVCSATSRLIVHEDIKDKVIEGIIKTANAVKIGSGLKSESKVGPLINGAQFERVVGYIDKTVSEGGKLLCGGNPSKDSSLSGGYFVRPTIFEVNPSMTIWKEEVFGPVLGVVTFKTEEEAIRLANDSDFGLGAAVVSTNPQTCKRITNALRAGIVWVNCSQPTLIQAPWGGYKTSGIGRELGPWGLENYLETKQVCSWVNKEATGWGWFQ